MRQKPFQSIRVMKKVLLLLSFFLCVFANSAEAINEVNETLTHYNVADSKLLSIDDVTISILREIGWDTERQAPVTISCADTISDGVASAYIPNHFSLCRNGNSVQVQTWQLLLKHNDGSFVNYYSQIGGDTLTISPVANNSSAYMNIDGYMEGEIVLKIIPKTDVIKITTKENHTTLPRNLCPKVNILMMKPL